MKARPTSIPDCVLIELPAFHDDRGTFVKNFHEEQFRSFGLETNFPEEFYTRSLRGVLRGFHFTIPPIDQVKLVTCIQGAILDVVIDLRRHSPTYREHLKFELDADEPRSLYIGKGLGHAFYVRSSESVLAYRVSTLYNPKYDAGIRWDSAGIDWPSDCPIVSGRDKALPTLSEFSSPFRFQRQNA